MGHIPRDETATPRATILEALVQIEAAYPRLRFRDDLAADEATVYIAQGLRAIRNQLHRAEPDDAPLSPRA